MTSPSRAATAEMLLTSGPLNQGGPAPAEATAAAAAVFGCRDLNALAKTPAPAGGTTPGAARAFTYTVALPVGMKLLNANDRLHWRARNDLVQSIVDAAIIMVRKTKVPKLDRVTIRAVLHPNDARRRDPHNWYPSIKAGIDGIVRAGVLVDDDATHLLGVEVVLGEPVKRGQLVLHITPASVPQPAGHVLEDASPVVPADCGDGYFDAAGPDRRDIDILVIVGGLL